LDSGVFSIAFWRRKDYHESNEGRVGIHVYLRRTAPEEVLEKRGVVFRTKGLGPQCVFRIPLPHMGWISDFLCAAFRFGLPNHKRRSFYV
jgi:hypothetical protein